MLELKIEQLVLIAGFFLPGAISMYVYGLKVPQKEFELKDSIAEAICFSLLNFLIVWLPVRQALAFGTAQAYPGISWIVLILGFVVIPVAWPFAAVWLLQRAEKHGWIAVRARTAWDDFFGRQQTECWLQVELTDGRVIAVRSPVLCQLVAGPWASVHGVGMAGRRGGLFRRSITGQCWNSVEASRLQTGSGPPGSSSQ